MTKTGKRFELTTDASRVDLKDLGKLYASVGFGVEGDYEKESMSVEKIFGPGVYGFFAFDGDHLIGVARVLSDNLICSWIAEICVHPDWQGQGIGSALVGMMNDRFPNTALYAEAFKSQEGFFVGRGIVPQSRIVACGRAPIKSL